MHGRLSQAVECRGCHAEHHGPDGVLTSLEKFDHSLTAFKLTGKHATLECKACHANNVFEGTAQSCVACHAEPKIHRGKFGTDCKQCHATSTWTTALNGLDKFDHNLTSFKLTGKHATIDCKACHANNVFQGTSQSCVACHAEPKVHQAKFGTDCKQCHTTTTWAGTTFKHTFPLNHGHRRSTIKNSPPPAHDTQRFQDLYLLRLP